MSGLQANTFQSLPPLVGEATVPTNGQAGGLI